MGIKFYVFGSCGIILGPLKWYGFFMSINSLKCCMIGGVGCPIEQVGHPTERGCEGDLAKLLIEWQLEFSFSVFFLTFCTS